jgi:DNA-directed RNA polymerase specialized sigma24 family protein
LKRVTVASSTSLKKHWALTQEAFEKLLACLDPDRERAGQQYEDIRHSLITFFECRGSFSPEDQADESISRVARRLVEGKEIYVENAASYFYGVARNVLKEQWETPEFTPLESLPPSKALSDDPNHLREQQLERDLGERRLECLEYCLQELPSRNRGLISEYYQGETRMKIQNRQSLAQKLGIPLNALRIRALRIREKLEDCVENCLERAPDG